VIAYSQHYVAEGGEFDAATLFTHRKETGDFSQPQGLFGHVAKIQFLPGINPRSLSPYPVTAPGVLSLFCSAGHFGNVWSASRVREIKYRE
jgi:hypothetical protein